MRPGKFRECAEEPLQTPLYAENPPSMGTTTPVTNSEAGESSHITAPMRSRGFTKARHGRVRENRFAARSQFSRVFVEQQEAILIGQEESRRNRVHANLR